MAKTKKAQKTLEPSGKENALQRVIAQIEKQYGQGSIMQMDEHRYARVEGIPTGALSLVGWEEPPNDAAGSGDVGWEVL